MTNQIEELYKVAQRAISLGNIDKPKALLSHNHFWELLFTANNNSFVGAAPTQISWLHLQGGNAIIKICITRFNKLSDNEKLFFIVWCGFRFYENKKHILFTSETLKDMLADRHTIDFLKHHNIVFYLAEQQLIISELYEQKTPNHLQHKRIKHFMLLLKNKTPINLSFCMRYKAYMRRAKKEKKKYTMLFHR